MNIYNNKDLKIVKNKGIIEKMPNYPIGYYKLGQTYLSTGNIKDAITSYRQALTVDNNYVKAAIGLVVSYIYSGKYISAVREYKLYQDVINSKVIYKKYTCKMLNKYLLICSENGKVNLSNIIRYFFGYKKVEEIFRSNAEDVFSILVLTDGIISGKNKHLKVSPETVLKKCAKIKWITDEYRWDIFEVLGDNISKHEKQELIRSFNTIPKNCSDSIFINKIFEGIIYKGNINTIPIAFYNIKNKGILSSGNLWNYIDKFKDNMENTDNLLDSCKLLIARGWIDSVVADCIFKLKRKGLLNKSSNEEKIVKLYGFNDN